MRNIVWIPVHRPKAQNPSSSVASKPKRYWGGHHGCYYHGYYPGYYPWYYYYYNGLNSYTEQRYPYV